MLDISVVRRSQSNCHRRRLLSDKRARAVCGGQLMSTTTAPPRRALFNPRSLITDQTRAACECVRCTCGTRRLLEITSEQVPARALKSEAGELTSRCTCVMSVDLLAAHVWRQRARWLRHQEAQVATAGWCRAPAFGASTVGVSRHVDISVLV